MMRVLNGVLIVVAVSLILLLLLQPVGTDAQWAIAEACLVAMLTIKLLKLSGYWRHLFFTLGAILVLRYVYWRTTSTLPSPEHLQDFIPGILLYAAEMFCVVMLALSLFVISRPITRGRAPVIQEGRAPTVDVFVPSYNEDSSLLALTLAAAKGMDYPADRMKVYLLDDGGTEEKINSTSFKVADAAARRRHELQELCRVLDVTYLTREKNVHAKAGNLSNGLLHSRGDLVVVFDADHAPAREFLRETVGFFAQDPKLFLVQTPHFFVNADPIEKNLSTFDSMPSESEMFYGMIQKGLDKWNAAFFCGSAAVLRRSALEQVGGFAGTSITEDCETALELHAAGWNSVYVAKPLIAGLQPETFSSFIGQRSRWCSGMLQILLMKNPLFKKGLSPAQRICYLSTCMFWLFPIPRMAFLFAPLLFIFFNLKIYNSTVAEFGAYTMTYLVAAVLLQSYAYGRFRWPWISELYEYLQSVYLLKSIAGVIRNPRSPKFNVTAKGGSTEQDHLSGFAWPYFLIFVVLLLAQGTVFYRMHAEPEAAGLLLIVGFWNMFNLMMAGLALGAVCERRERRQSHRLPTEARGTLSVDGLVFVGSVIDISQGGMLVRASGKEAIRLQSSARLALTLPGKAPASVSIPVRIANVRSEGDDRIIGVSFETLNAVEYGAVARMMYSDLTLLRGVRQSRQRSKSIVLGTAQILLWGFRQTLRGGYYALFRREPASTVPATTH